jgi:NgoPII restriction endonuclease
LNRNVLDALICIANYNVFSLEETYKGANRINNIGNALEDYVQRAFSSTLNLENNLVAIQRTFSYIGNTNNPPDMMLRGGAAIEVKKLEGLNNSIALNSSPPKQRLYSQDSRITVSCRNAEEWQEKDLIYVIGCVKNKIIQRIWFVYGDCYAAHSDTYTRVSDSIRNGIAELADIEFTETDELAKIKKVDPLGITDLRVRGMWHIANPNKVFNYINMPENAYVSCILKRDTYEAFSKEQKETLERLENCTVSKKQIKDPDNPAQLIDATFIDIIKP